MQRITGQRKGNPRTCVDENGFPDPDHGLS
jgi:hypothetical protein